MDEHSLEDANLIEDPCDLCEFEYLQIVQIRTLVESTQSRQACQQVEDQELEQVRLGNLDHVVLVPCEVILLPAIILVVYDDALLSQWRQLNGCEEDQDNVHYHYEIKEALHNAELIEKTLLKR